MNRSQWRFVLCIMLCSVTVAAMALPTALWSWPAMREALDSVGWREGFATALGFCGLWLLYGAWLRQPKPFSCPSLWLLAGLFAGVMTLGGSYQTTGTAELVRLYPFSAFLHFIGRVPFYAAVMRLMESALRPGKPQTKRGLSLIMGGALLLCWLPYLYYIFPGTVSNDSVTQIMEIIGVEPLGNANPIFQTALIYLFRGVGVALNSADAAVFLYCGVQALLMAWLLGCLLKGMWESGTPRWLRVLCFCFLAFCPVFPLFAFCMGKDTNFSMAVLWLSLLALRFLRRPPESKCGVGECLCLCGAGILCTLLRNPGFYLALLTLGVLLVWTLCRPDAKKRWLTPLSAMAAVALVYGVLHLAIIPGLEIAPMPATENLSVPLQQTARVAASHPLTEDEAAAIDGVLDLDKLPAAYNGELSDPVKFLWRDTATEAQKADFFRVWRGFLTKYPATCLSATFHNTYGYLYPGYMSDIKPTLLIGRQKRSTPEVEAAFDYTVNPRADSLKAFTDRLAQNPLYRVVIAPGLYGWLCLFAVTVLLRRGDKRLLIAAVPAVFSLMGCLLSAVNGYFRYAMPLYLCAPMLLWLCALPLSATKEGKHDEADYPNSLL